MSDLRIKTGTSSVSLGNSDGTPVDVRGTRDGAMFTAPWITAHALEGRCFAMNTGVGSTPDVFTNGYTNTKPDAYVTVPAGTTIIPVLIEVTQEDSSTAGVIDCMAIASTVADTSPSGTAVTVYSMRMDVPFKSLCTATATVSTGTTPYDTSGNFIEFWRGSAGMVEDAYATLGLAQTSGLNIRTQWCVRDCPAPPVIVGPGSVSVHVSNNAGSSTSGWITIVWVEVPTNSIV